MEFYLCIPVSLECYDILDVKTRPFLFIGWPMCWVEEVEEVFNYNIKFSVGIVKDVLLSFISTL